MEYIRRCHTDRRGISSSKQTVSQRHPPMRAKSNGANMMYGTGPPLLGTSIGVKNHSTHAATPQMTASTPYRWPQCASAARKMWDTEWCITVSITGPPPSDSRSPLHRIGGSGGGFG